MTDCFYKHTKYQPSDDEFCCPKCGAQAGDFCIDASPDNDCSFLHEDDSLVCFGKDGGKGPCRHYVSGKAFAAGVVKKKKLIPCKYCKGKGYVKGKS